MELPRQRMIQNFSLLILILLISASTTSCSTAKKQAAEAYTKGYSAADKLLQENLVDATRTRRILGIVFYIKNGNSPQNLDFSDSLTKKQSFARFVCAGQGDYDEEVAHLAILNKAKEILDDLAKEPPDDVVGLWKSIGALSAKQQLTLDTKQHKRTFASCVADTITYIDNPGAQYTDSLTSTDAKRMIPAVIAALPVMITAVESAIKYSLSLYSTYKREKAIGEFVISNEELIKKTITFLKEKCQLSPLDIAPVPETRRAIGGACSQSMAPLDELFEQRRSANLVLPYQRFMALNPPMSNDSLIKEAIKIDLELAQFDQLKFAKRPSELLSVIEDAYEHLKTVALESGNWDLSLKNLEAFGKLLKELYEAAQTSRDELAKKTTS